MVPYLGDFKEDDTVLIVFNTFTSNDPSASCTITNFANTDVHIHKEDDLTQRNNAAGITVSVDFDGITGSHMIKIDTNDDTVAGFWVTGKDYFVRIEGTTIDGATINVFVGHFSIENRFQEVDVVKLLGTAWLAPTVAGTPDVNTKTLTDGAIAAAKLGADCITNAKIADDAIAAENIKAAAIDNATFAADVGSTVYATNIIALALRKALDEINLDHLMKVAVSNRDTMPEVVDDTVLANIMTKTDGDTSDFDHATDSLEAIKDVAPHGSAMVGTNGANTVVPDAAGTAPTAVEIQTEMEENGASLLDTIRDDLANGTDGLGALKTLIEACSTHDAAAVKTAIEAAGSSLAQILTDTGTTLDVIVDKILALFSNKLTFVNLTGAATLRNIGDSADLATWGVTDDDTNTVRTEVTWV